MVSGRGFSVLTMVFTGMSILEETDFGYGFNILEEDIEEARERKAEHVYQNFIYPVLQDFSGREVFQPDELQDEIRPPYSYTEVKDALEYASFESEDVEFLEEDMDLFLYTGT